MATLMKTLQRLENYMLYLDMFVLSFMAIWVCSDASGRYLFNHPLPGALEISEEILMVLLVFFSLSYCQRLKGHVRVELLDNHIPPKLKVWVDFFMDLFNLAFNLLVTYTAINAFSNAVEMQTVSRSILAYPMAPVYGFMVFGMLVFCLRMLVETLENLQKALRFNSCQGGVKQ